MSLTSILESAQNVKREHLESVYKTGYNKYCLSAFVSVTGVS